MILEEIKLIEKLEPQQIEGLINFQKRAVIYRLMVSLQDLLKRPYNLQRVHQIVAFLSQPKSKWGDSLTVISAMPASGNSSVIFPPASPGGQNGANQKEKKT